MQRHGWLSSFYIKNSSFWIWRLSIGINRHFSTHHFGLKNERNVFWYHGVNPSDQYIDNIWWNLWAACSVCLLAWWTFCRATLLMIKPVKQKHCDVTDLPDRNNAIIPSTCSQAWPWIVSTRLLANVSLWVKVLSLVWAASTSATLFSNAKLNLSATATLSWSFQRWQNGGLHTHFILLNCFTCALHLSGF